MLKRYLLFFIAAYLLINRGFAQEVIEKRFKLTNQVTEIFQVLKSNEQIKQGFFQAIYKKKIAVASGKYANNQKTGIWHYYDTNGTLLENVDHNTNTITYEAPEDTSSYLRYVVDKLLDKTSKTTKPLKEGGRYYGYIPYLSLFTIPKNITLPYGGEFPAVVELLISPYGRLAEYKVHINFLEGERIINMNIHLPNPDDTKFIPATLNDEPIASRILISCLLNDNGKLNFK